MDNFTLGVCRLALSVAVMPGAAQADGVEGQNDQPPATLAAVSDFPKGSTSSSIDVTGSAAQTPGVLGGTQAAANPPVSQQASEGSAPKVASDGLADIVVTAEKRSVSGQKAPSAITVISGDALEARGIQNIQQAQVLAPSVKLGAEATSTQAFIRGVGLTLDTANIEPLVAINFNGILMPREATGGANIFDVDRVEILPGPQGTLYGRSASGGVINVGFKRPGTTLGGDLLLELGNFDQRHAAGAIDLPASDALRFRIAANYNNRDGYTRTGSGAEDDFGVRLSTIVEPTERLSVFAWGSYISHRGSIPNAVNKPFLNPADPYNDLQPAGLQPFGQTQRGSLHQDIYIAGGEANYHGDGFTITYIPGYTSVDTLAFNNLAGLPNSFAYTIRQHSNDLRLSTAIGSRLQVLGGIYEFNQVYRNYRFTLPFGNVSDIPYSLEAGVSGFAQGIYSLTDRLRLTAGGRYSTTRRRAEANEYLGAGIPSRPFSFNEHYNHFDYKVGIEADIGSRSLAYAVVQTGYSPGTFNTSPSLPLLPAGFLPTKLTSYTLGTKNRFFHNRLQLNLEGFYYNYTDLLISALNALTGQQTVSNAKKVELYGAQLDVRVTPTSSTELYASIGYLHAENKDFIIPQFNAPSVNLNGLSPPYSPRWTLNFGGSKTLSLGGGYKLVGRADSHYESISYSQFDRAPGTDSPAYWKTDASIAFVPRGERLTVGIWANNIENTVHLAIGGSGGVPGPAAVVLDRPRTYGLRMAYKF